MTTHVVADDVLGGIARKQWELSRRLMEGSLDPVIVSTGLQEIIEGKIGFARYPYLLDPEEQFELILRYNQQYWGDYFSAEKLETCFDGLSIDWENPKLINDLQILHVEFGSLEETVEMWWRVLVGEQHEGCNEDRDVNFHPDIPFRLLDHNVQVYNPGVHVVRINLVPTVWKSEDCLTLDQVREHARERDQTLAHTEVMSAYGLHIGLFFEQVAYREVIMAGSSMPTPSPNFSTPLALSLSNYGGDWGLGVVESIEKPNTHFYNGWVAPVILQS